MFFKKDPPQANFKLVLLSGERHLGEAVLRRLHESLPAERKEKIRVVRFGDVQILFFSVPWPGMPPIDGAEVWLHFYALGDTGGATPEEWAANETRLLAGVDGVLLAAPAGARDVHAIESRARSVLEGLRYEWAAGPVVVEAPGTIAAERPVVALGEGPTALAQAVVGAHIAGTLKGPERDHAEQEAMNRLHARTDVALDYYEKAGADASETFTTAEPADPAIHVFHFSPSATRPHVTYATFARRLDAFEIIAHAPASNPEIPALVANLSSGDFAPFHTARFGDDGPAFLLVPPLAWPASIEGTAFLQAVPITSREHAFAQASGGEALAAKLDLATRGPAFGWGRGEGESVVS